MSCCWNDAATFPIKRNEMHQAITMYICVLSKMTVSDLDVKTMVTIYFFTLALMY
jgi:hypothetical protein